MSKLQNWRKRNKDKMKRYEKRRVEKLNELKDKLFGNRCKLCNKTRHERKLVLHEIHGKSHPKLDTFEKINSLNPKDFIRLCTHHHCILHRFKDEKINLELFLKLLKEME